MYPFIGPILSATIFYLLGIAAHFIISWRVARDTHLENRVWIAASLCYFFGMVVGAKMLSDIRQSEFDFIQLFSLRHYFTKGLWGGLLAYVFLAVPIVTLLTRKKREALDLVAVTIPLPWIISKVGCLLHGCCYGRPSSLPWAITFPVDSRAAPTGIPLHPTQAYEIIIMVVALWVFNVLPRERWRGTLLLWFVAIYGFSRAATDFFRGDLSRHSHYYFGCITVTQVICVIIGLLSVLLLLRSQRWQRTGTVEDGSRRPEAPSSGMRSPNP